MEGAFIHLMMVKSAGLYHPAFAFHRAGCLLLPSLPNMPFKSGKKK
jgi:hypothetical protein